MNVILTFIFGYVVGIGTPYLKNILGQIVKKGYEKLSREIERWH